MEKVLYDVVMLLRSVLQIGKALYNLHVDGNAFQINGFVEKFVLVVKEDWGAPDSRETECWDLQLGIRILEKSFCIRFILTALKK